MTDQAPELLPDIVERCRRYAVVIEGIIVVPDDWQPGEDHREVKEPRATLLEAADIIERLTRPTPAERPVPQVREALEAVERHLSFQHKWLLGRIRTEGTVCAETWDQIEATYSIWKTIKRALTARPSDAAVAWLPVQILVKASENNGGLVKFRSGRELLISKVEAASLALPPDEPARVIDKGK